MNPPRWNSPNADKVRDELARRFENENSPAPVTKVTMWDSRHRANTVRLAVAIVIALALIVPASVYTFALAGRPHPAGASHSVEPTTISSPARLVTPTPTTTPIPTFTPTTGVATGPGCPATSATMPKGAVSAAINDADGDGKPDTEWAVQALGGTLQFGITTASGATISGSQGFAGGGDRTFVVGKLANGVVVAITSEDRDSPVYTFSGCAFHALRGGDLFSGARPNSQFTFYSADGGGDGGCYDGRLALVHLTNMPGDPTGDNEQAIARWVDVSADGLRATLTDQSATIATNLNYTTDPTRYFHYNGTSCGPSEVLHPIYHAK